MTVRHWAWIFVGLLVWAGIAYLWATGPRDCQPPDRHHHVACR